jgi:hypothetical protein
MHKTLTTLQPQLGCHLSQLKDIRMMRRLDKDVAYPNRYAILWQ